MKLYATNVHVATYADNNYLGEADEDVLAAMNRVIRRMENLSKWLLMSGLKINVEKTEICIFHTRNIIAQEVELNNVKIVTKNNINVLGILFDSSLK